MDSLAFLVIFGVLFVAANQGIDWLVRVYDRGKRNLGERP